MEKFEDALKPYYPQVLSICRIVFGLLILQHGLSKHFGFPAPQPANFQLLSMVGLAGALEVILGGLVVVGLFTRFSAFILSGEMAVAYLIYANRMARGVTPIVNGGNLEVAYCFAFLLIAFAGAGVWSLDAMIRKRS